MMPLVIARDAVLGSIRNWRLWVIQFLVNPVLFALFTGWLLIREANIFLVFLNMLGALAILVAAFVLHAGTLNYFHDMNRSGDTGNTESLKSAFLRALRHIAAIAICAAVIYLLWMLVDKADSYQETFPTYIRSTLPAFLRRHIDLAFLMGAFTWIEFAIRWIVIPGLVLPFVLETADRGFHGLGRAGLSSFKRAVASISYWLILVVAALVAVLAPPKLMARTPDFRFSTYPQELTSMIFRLLLSYLLGLAAWMVTCSLVGRHSVPDRNQPTVLSE